MLTHKIFHLRQPLPQARESLRDFGTWTAAENDAELHCSLLQPQGIGHVELAAGPGSSVSADIQEVPGDDPNRILFRSVGGNIELAGLIELFPIRPNLTEVVLTLDYASPLQKAFDAVDRFLNRQLARIEGCVHHAVTDAPGFA